MPNCALCDKRPEALPFCKLCRPCLEISERFLQGLRATEPTPTPAFLRDWAAFTAQEERFSAPVVAVLRGVLQGVVLSADMFKAGSAEREKVVRLEVSAQQALVEGLG